MFVFRLLTYFNFKMTFLFFDSYIMRIRATVYSQLTQVNKLNGESIVSHKTDVGDDSYG